MNIYLNETSFQYINNFLNILEESLNFNIPNDVKNKINKISKEAMESKKIKVALPKSKPKLNIKNFKEKPGKLNNTMISPLDSCFTAMLKIVGKEKLAEKVYYSSGNFLLLYCAALQKKNRKMMQLTEKNIKELKKGHIIAIDPYTCETYLSGRSEYHILSNIYDVNDGVLRDKNKTSVKTGAHFILVLNIDTKEKNLTILHATQSGNVNFGSWLELTTEKIKFDKLLKKQRPAYVLDYSLFPEVEKLAEKK